MSSVSVIIPVYRAGHTIYELHRKLSVTMPAISSSYEIILVEDGGEDHSWDIICDIANTDPLVRGIRMSRNFGQHNALLCGIRAARHELIVTMDDDLQNPVEEIARLISALHKEVDVIYGYPNIRQHGMLREFASHLTKIALSHAMGAETARRVSAFRAFRTRLREGFQNYSSPSVSIDVLLTWATSRFSAIEVLHAPRVAGISGYTLRKLIRHAFNLVTGFSTLPLQVASMVGFIFLIFGICVLAFVLLHYLIFGGLVPGFTFLASISSIFSGAQLFALGIFGEYLARMHFRSMDRPVYVVGETTAASSASPDQVALAK